MSATGHVFTPGSKAFCDTSPFIYFCEERQPYVAKLQRLFDENDRGEFQIITSTLTLVEVLILPLREQAWGLAAEYQEIIINSPFILVMPMDVAIAREAARLRARYRLQMPDAIQVATALVYGCSVFLTNDHQLAVVNELKVIQLADQ